ncbi:MDR family MFS transporter [Zafaria sp. Z1313]|uniref:MDR family MFS transporter n=1 Tax=unclassified Zafaria TaxID=2828765 RepID=UPI002E76B9B4|nr:MDR family MFS transporter [Zafaria sp. J156]MEE1621916.1 MDR family MFS transporter [Zafaria sp. J156]
MTQGTTVKPVDPRSAPVWNPKLALLVACTMFMEHLDGTILVTAAPQIARDFGVSSAQVGLAITAYLVTVATFIPVGGWLTSRYGARRVFCASIVLFTVASILCAASPNLGVLVAGRILQGLGGAMMVPVGRLVILRSTEKRDLLRAIAYITWPALLAPVLAPVVGGVITTYAGWHWIFLLNVPLGALALVVALRLVTDRSTEARPLDRVGLLWCTVAVFGLMAGMELATASTHVVVALAVLAAAFTALVLAVRWLLRVRTPLLDVRVYRIASYRVANSGGFVYRLLISAVPFLLPLMFQDGFGWTPVESGLLVMAVFIGNVGIKPATTPLLRRFGFRAVILTAVAGGGALIAGFAFLTPEVPVAVIAALLVASGALRSIGFTAYNSLQFSDVGPAQMPAANTLSSTTDQLASGLGVALGSLVLQAAAAPGPDAVGVLAGPLVPYQAAFLVMAAFTLLPLVSGWRLDPDAASEVTARPGR